jgi:hypothetical protein
MDLEGVVEGGEIEGEGEALEEEGGRSEEGGDK